MTASNDNTLSADWLELCRLNALTHSYSPKSMRHMRMASPRSVYNFLWFARFEWNYRDELARQARASLTVVNGG